MKYLDLTLPAPAANLACDEALLDWAEDGAHHETLRFWEPREHFVVLGYANRARAEVNLDACRQQNVPILRRCSGGGTVLQGPGCLNYSLILRIGEHVPLESITGTNALVMETHRRALIATLRREVEILGHTDLAIGQLKFSGNAQRRKRNALLFHGTFLLQFDLERIEALLPLPAKRPRYRGNRSHRDFLTNLAVPAAVVKEALKTAWSAAQPLEPPPGNVVEALVREKYSKDGWTYRF